MALTPGFTPAEREATRQWLLERARVDDEVVAAAVTGSAAAGVEDEWSDIDLALAVAAGAEPADVVARWTRAVEEHVGVVHHWDLAGGGWIYRVLLLPNALEVDLGFAPAVRFGARGPSFRLVFGEAVELPAPSGTDTRYLIGLAWHHLLHARACIARGKPWQAEWLISAARDHALALLCAPLGLATEFARGVDRLPSELRDAARPSLVVSLDDDELLRALGVVRRLVLDGARAHDRALAARLDGIL